MVHLKNLEATLLSQASDKELMLYRFLKGQKHSVRCKDNDLQTTICVKAFVSGGGKEELKSLKLIKPFKGLHYTNNLELLVAASLIEEECEIENLENYLQKRTAKEYFIINKALDRDFYCSKEATNQVEKLALKLLLDEEVNVEDIQNSFNFISDFLRSAPLIDSSPPA